MKQMCIYAFWWPCSRREQCGHHWALGPTLLVACPRNPAGALGLGFALRWCPGRVWMEGSSESYCPACAAREFISPFPPSDGTLTYLQAKLASSRRLWPAWPIRRRRSSRLGRGSWRTSPPLQDRGRCCLCFGGVLCAFVPPGGAFALVFS